jgi:O-acetyl-ADP-ribose deacetylase
MFVAAQTNRQRVKRSDVSLAPGTFYLAARRGNRIAGKAMGTLKTFLNDRVAVKVGDITKERVDAIVNAANGTLMGGGGVDGAIHRTGGPEILNQCKEIRAKEFPHGLPTGEAVITTAGRMVAKHVIHTVGPVYGRGGDEKARLLASCYRNCLRLAIEHGLKTIAFPAVSTGIYGYPLGEAAKVSSQTIEESLGSNASLEQVRLVFFSQNDADAFLKNQVFTH